jgi:hypothetical protein
VNDESRPLERPIANISRRKPSKQDGLQLVELDRLLDVRERLVFAIDGLEAGEAGIDSCGWAS